MSHEDSPDFDAPVLDRRTFLGTGIALGAVLASGVALGIPKPLVAVADAAQGADGTGHIDDSCGHWPPYSHPIPYGYAAPAESPWEHWDAVDRNFMI